MKLQNLLKKASKITGGEPMGLTTSFSQFLESLEIRRYYVLFFWYFIFSPRVSPEGMIYLPKLFLIFPDRWILKILIHECNHIKHPERDEHWIRILTRVQLELYG